MNKKTKTFVEYILIITLITIFSIFIIKMFGGYLTDFVTKASCKAVDKVYKDGIKPGEGTCVNN